MEIPDRINFDRVADIYDETRAIPEPFFTKAIATMEDYLDREERVLDIGVGTGRFAIPLQRRGFSVVGVDISEKMLGVGLSKGLRDSVLADARCIPFKDKVFHSTISVHLLHLLPDWVDVVMETMRVTKVNFVTYSQYWPEEENVTPNLLYDEIIKEHGHNNEPMGLHEKDLPNMVEPYARKHIGTMREIVSADDRIDRLGKRIYSYQWSIPDGVHEKAIEEVRNRFGGKEVSVRADLFVFVWKIQDLREVLGDVRSEE